MKAQNIVADGTVTIAYGSHTEVQPFKVIKAARAGKVRFEFWCIDSGCAQFSRWASSPFTKERLLDYVKNGTVNMLAMNIN